MERDANYGLIGGLTLALLAAAFGFILWLGQSQFARNFDEYRLIFDDPDRGLSEGGEVQFNGIPVGEITRTRLDPRNPNREIGRAHVRTTVTHAHLVRRLPLTRKKQQPDY